MDDKKIDKEVLENIQATIKFFDNKASILISVIGIVFGLSLNFLNFFALLKDNMLNGFINRDEYINKFWMFFTILIIYFIIAALSIIFSLLVFYPRKNKNNDKDNINYYLDLKQMDFNSYSINKKKWVEDDQMIWKQIKINSDICLYKHKWLIKSGILFILFLLFFITLIILNVSFIF